jgi:Arc/MetJ family transcription regulator
MATNLGIDDAVIEQVLTLSGERTKKAAVTVALNEYIQRHKQAKILDYFGTVDFDPDWDYKAIRQRDNKRLTLDPL